MREEDAATSWLWMCLRCNCCVQRQRRYYNDTDEGMPFINGYFMFFFFYIEMTRLCVRLRIIAGFVACCFECLHQSPHLYIEQYANSQRYELRATSYKQDIIKSLNGFFILPPLSAPLSFLSCVAARLWSEKLFVGFGGWWVVVGGVGWWRRRGEENE